jgi:hypothetical protein
MASAIAFGSASPHSLTLTVTGNGGATTQNAAAVLAACAEGPLKVFLGKVPDWTVFNLGHALCDRVHVRELINRAAGNEPSAFEFFWTAQGIKADSNSAGGPQLEIRLAHSSRR